MARKAAQKKEVNNDGKELFEALKLLEAEKGIPVDFMIDKIKKAIATACKNSYGNEDVVIDMDPESGKFDVFLRKEIVEEVENPNREIALEIVKQFACASPYPLRQRLRRQVLRPLRSKAPSTRQYRIPIWSRYDPNMHR